ncbi:MAG: YdeI/OmpD-associated family protein, partial [Pseudomonadota bacterium]
KRIISACRVFGPCFSSTPSGSFIRAFRGDFRLSFFDAALMKDPEGVLEKQGPNTRHADMIRFDGNDQPARMEAMIRAYLTEAMGYAAAGVVPPKDTSEIALPEELIEAMDADPELAEAFHALTPGRQKSYAFNLGGAKKAETRIARIAKFRPHILAGKGALER